MTNFVGRYELLHPIGHGGIAVVYLARQTDLDRLVALKELRVFDSPDDPAIAERFLREAHTAGAMSHPNIVTVHEYFEHDGRPYIAMEYLERGSLRPWVGGLTLAQVAGVLEGALAALDHAEQSGIVHRDLKPENLLVTEQGQIKVADFGIAKARTLDTRSLLTEVGTTVGTPTYMAPEQAMALEVGTYTDLYSLGVIAYELLVGRVPFHETETPVAIILRHVNEVIPSAHAVDPSIDPGLSDWVDRLLVKEPADRTQTAEDAWEQLEETVLRLLGSRWRRDARLPATSEPAAARLLTPAPFTSMNLPTPPGSGAFQSFVWPRPEPAASGAPAAPPAPVPRPVEPPAWQTVAPAAPPSPVEPPAWQTVAPAAQSPSSPVPPPPPPAPAPWPEPPVSVAAADPDPDVYAPTVMPDAVPVAPSPPPRARGIRRPPRLGLALAAASAVVVVAVGGVAAFSGGSGSKASTAGTFTLQNADLALTVPTAWTKSAAAVRLPGFSPATGVGAVRKATASDLAARLVAGRADSSLLSPELLRTVNGHPPKPATVKLGPLEAYRYALPVASSSPLRVYAVLTTAGVATVACDAGAPDCDAIARTLRLKAARGLSVGPSADYAAILRSTFATLKSGIAAVQIKFRKAPPTVAAQVQAQREFAHVYSSAIALLNRGHFNPVDDGLRFQIGSVFGTFASAYRLLARGILAGDAGARSRAERTLRRADGKIGDATQALGSAGYTVEVPHLQTPVPKAPPPAPPPPPPPPPAAVTPVAPQAPKPTAPKKPSGGSHAPSPSGPLGGGTE